MNRLRTIWKRQPLATIAFVIAIGAAGFFGARVIGRVVYWANPAHHAQAPEGWMTVGYIAKSWRLKKPDVGAALDLTPEEYRKPLAAIARARGIPLASLIAELDPVLTAHD